MNMVKREAIQDIVKGFIQRGIVEECKSEWNAPAFLVEKEPTKRIKNILETEASTGLKGIEQGCQE
jgi:hypothetical protein